MKMIERTKDYNRFLIFVLYIQYLQSRAAKWYLSEFRESQINFIYTRIWYLIRVFLHKYAERQRLAQMEIKLFDYH